MAVPSLPARARAADAVHVGLRILRQGPVHHVRQALHVDAARGYVGCHEDARLAGAEARHDPVTVLLRVIAVERLHRIAALLEGLADAVRVDAGAREDKAVEVLLHVHDAREGFHLVLLPHLQPDLLGELRRRGLARDLRLS